jgi:hypothetical protein
MGSLWLLKSLVARIWIILNSRIPVSVVAVGGNCVDSEWIPDISIRVAMLFSNQGFRILQLLNSCNSPIPSQWSAVSRELLLVRIDPVHLDSAF